MTPGDHLIYVADPLGFGVLELVAIARDGTLWCEELITGHVHRFRPHEVDLSPDLYVAAEERWAA